MKVLRHQRHNWSVSDLMDGADGGPGSGVTSVLACGNCMHASTGYSHVCAPPMAGGGGSLFWREVRASHAWPEVWPLGHRATGQARLRQGTRYPPPPGAPDPSLPPACYSVISACNAYLLGKRSPVQDMGMVRVAVPASTDPFLQDEGRTLGGGGKCI